jgi:hypothetical protein
MYRVIFYAYRNDRYIFHNVNYFPDEELLNLYFQFINYNIHFVAPELNNSPNNFIGGVFGIRKEDFEKINGFPNNFFGQGVEDEAFYNRCAKNDLVIYRPTKGSFHFDDKQNVFKIDKTNKYSDNISYDIKNSSSNGLKQLLNFFINIKKYSIDDFISNYGIIDRNSTNNSEMLQSYILKNINNQSINSFKIDYLASFFVMLFLFYFSKTFEGLSSFN